MLITHWSERKEVVWTMEHVEVITDRPIAVKTQVNCYKIRQKHCHHFHCHCHVYFSLFLTIHC